MTKSHKTQTMVFLHGWGGRIDSWQNQIQFFESNGFNCIAMKMPGFDFPEPPINWGIPEYAEYVINNLPDKDSAYILVGHSFGGRVSVYLASHHPKIVEKLVLTDAAGLNLEVHSGRKVLITFSQLANKVQETLPLVKSMRSLLRKLLGSKNFREASPVMREVMKTVVNLDLQENLPLIRAKTLIVWGELDKTTPILMANAFHKGIHGSQLKVVSGAGHAPHRTHTKEWNEIVLHFLKSG
ncbi:MAG: alpha/beta hydrolase [Candidatus Brocadia sp.]|nr:alpha/beta hydrolase [Candidatus Brocadia sp.]